MFARTRRLTLRPGWPEDAAALTAAIAHEAVAFKLSRMPWPYTQDHAADWLARVRSKRDVRLLILTHDGPEPHLVGSVGVHPLDDGTAHEMGYWLTPSAWGRGYATEAGRAMLDIARHAMGLDRLVSGYFVDNPASGRVLTKLGFRETGRTVARPCLALGEDRPGAIVECDLATDRLALAA